MILSQMMSLGQISSQWGYPSWCTQEFLHRYVYSAEKAYVASHFVLEIFWTCDLSIYMYIFDAHGCTFYGFICEYFYDDMKCNAYVMYFYMCVCVCVLYMIMHDVVFVCFLYAIMNVRIQDVISHLICYTIEVSGDMCECDGLKCSNHLFSAHEFSKEEGVTYPVVVVQLRNKQLGV